MLLFLAAVILIQHGLISCRNSDASDPTVEYKTKTGKSIIINEVHCDGQSLSTIEVSTSDFEYNFPDVSENEQFFEGYMGHDTYKIKKNKLIRSFPVYHRDDPNSKPSGGERVLTYGLVPGEAMWQLKIEKAETQNK